MTISARTQNNADFERFMSFLFLQGDHHAATVNACLPTRNDSPPFQLVFQSLGIITPQDKIPKRQ